MPRPPIRKLRFRRSTPAEARRNPDIEQPASLSGSCRFFLSMLAGHGKRPAHPHFPDELYSAGHPDTARHKFRTFRVSPRAILYGRADQFSYARRHDFSVRLAVSTGAVELAWRATIGRWLSEDMAGQRGTAMRQMLGPLKSEFPNKVVPCAPPRNQI